MTDETTHTTLLGEALNEAGGAPGEGGAGAPGDGGAGAPGEGAGSTTGEGAGAGAGEGEGKKEGEGAGEGKKEGEGEGKKEGEGDAIVYDFVAPEGMDLDTEMLDQLKGVCTKLKVPKEDAQSLLDLGVSLVRKNADAARKAWSETIDGWETAIKNDPALGGEKLKASMAVAARPIARFGSTEFRKMVSETGIGSNPHFFAFMHAIGSAMADDNPPAGDKTNSGAGAELDKAGLAAALFPTTTPKH